MFGLGWIKLHRKILDWQWASNPPRFQLAIYLLLMANHKEKKWLRETIRPGQLVTSYNSLEKITGLSKSTVRRALNDLEKCDFVTLKRTQKYTMISITNWSEYQGADTLVDTQVSTLVNTQVNTKQEVKNERMKEEEEGVDYKSVLRIFNSTLGTTLRSVRSLSNTRRSKIKSLSSKYFKTSEDWGEYFKSVKCSSFLCGENNRSWKADFDWLLKESNVLKVTEGNYKNRDEGNVLTLADLGGN